MRIQPARCCAIQWAGPVCPTVGECAESAFSGSAAAENLQHVVLSDHRRLNAAHARQWFERVCHFSRLGGKVQAV